MAVLLLDGSDMVSTVADSRASEAKRPWWSVEAVLPSFKSASG